MSVCEINWWPQLQHTDVYLLETQLCCKARKHGCSSKTVFEEQCKNACKKSKISQVKKQNESSSFKNKLLQNKIPYFTKQQKPFVLEGEKHAACRLHRDHQQQVSQSPPSPPQKGWSIVQS